MADCYLGEIRLFAGRKAPQGWLFCQGQTLNITEQNALYALIGTTYGGDGAKTFMLPDLRGKVAIGFGAGTGLSAYALGQKGGSENVTLTTAQIAAHSHAFNATTLDATSPLATNGASTFATVATNSALYNDSTQPQSTTTNWGANTITQNGGSIPHDNFMPTLVLNYIIATSGMFPT